MHTEKFDKWRQWLEEIRQEMNQLAFVDDVFWQVNAIIGANPKINTLDRYQLWQRLTYTHTVLVGIRRLSDKTKRTRSLRNLLFDMRSNATLFTRDRYVKLYSPEAQNIADIDFSALCDANASHIPKSYFTEKLDRLESTSETISNFVNDHIAHRSFEKSAASIDYSDIRLGILNTFKIYRWCNLAVLAEGIVNIVPVGQRSWLHHFTVPWIKDIKDLPPYKSLDDLLKD